MDTAPPPSLLAIPITAIRPSSTKIQQLRRSHFDPQKLLDLADSIKTQGVLQPILVRPRTPDGIVKYELVAGERRWIAADRAGLAHIDCNVRDLTDDQVLEAQLVENLQREDVHPLEEAEGYRELMALKKLDADAVAALIGKSRAYVYARVKLLDLCDAGRTALDAGHIDASKALLIARFKGHKLQAQALKRLMNSPHYSYKAALDTLRENFMIDLSRAPFLLIDPGYVFTEGKGKHAVDTPLPACTACPHYSQNDLELQASFDADAHICTDRQCHDSKVVQFYARERGRAEQAGRTVLTGDAAKAALPDGHYSAVSLTHLDLGAELPYEDFPETEPDDEADEPSAEWLAWDERRDAWGERTFRALLNDVLAKKPGAIVLAEDAKGKLHELLPIEQAQKLLKAHDIDLAPPVRQQSFPVADTAALKLEREKQEERQAREKELRGRVLQAVAAKWKPPLKQPDLAALTDELLDYDNRDELKPIYGADVNIEPARMKEPDLLRLLVLLSVCRCTTNLHQSPAALMALAGRLKIDPSKIKKEIAAEAKAKDKATKGLSGAAAAAAETARQVDARK